MGAHALLSPSSASRWLECPPSARLEADKPDRAGEAADEGTLAHKLSELMLALELKRISKADFNKKLEFIEKNKHYNDAMWEHCEQFKVFVMEQYAEAQVHTKDAHMDLEQQIDLTEFIPESFGTLDVSISADDLLHIIDLKYGKGVKVDATENKQLMLYGVGAVSRYAMLYDIKRVRMTIYQPRIDNYSTWEMSVKDLMQWANDTLLFTAQLAWQGEGKFKPGKHCQFCKVRTTCLANADYQMELAVLDFADPKELSNEQLADVFQRAAMFINWINSVKAYMLTEALSGAIYPGLKLVEGKSTGRKIIDEEKAKASLEKAKIDFDNFMSKPKLLGITALDKNIGKAEVQKLIGKYIVVPPGSPALVPADDKRAEYHSADAAAKDFE